MSNIPLYQNIVNILKKQIMSGEMKPGDQLPTEAQLSTTFNVSRITSKRALSELEKEHLIYRVQGKGSFVNPRLKPTRSSVTANREILLILPFADNPGIGDYIKGASEYLSGTEFTFHIQSNTSIGQRKLLEAALHSSNAGVLLYPQSSSADLDILYQYYLNDFPLITVDKCIEGIPFASVVSDNFRGGYEATRHLIKNNHKRIAYITSNKVEEVTSIKERYFGYLKALFDHGVQFEIDDNLPNILTLENTQSIEQRKDYYTNFIQSLLSSSVTAIIAENDILAIEIISIAKELNISIPSDLSIVGFDNIHMSNMIDPPLTTIAQDFTQLGYQAARHLIHRIVEGSWPSPPQQRVAVELIKRASVRTL
jgi:GntR family transcriptional regulator of arabinose operon